MKILIIGHELHSHTHSYIFNGIYRSLKYLNYDVEWIYNDEQLNKIKNENLIYNIIITELYYNKNIPIIKNCKYIIQQPFLELFKDSEYIYFNEKNIYITDEFMYELFKTIPKKNIIIWRPYLKLFTNIFFDVIEENEYKVIISPWATDLLPYEIDENIKNLESFEIKNISNFIGMPLQHNGDLKDTLKKYNIDYECHGGTFNKNSERNKSIEENMKLIQESIIAPALQSQWQKNNHYIPCRIFKNISYGKMGITNNETVYNLFNKKIIYSDNIEELVDKSLEFNKREDKFLIIKELMINVRDNHTYVNRINFILNLILN